MLASPPCPIYLASAWTFVAWRSCCSVTFFRRASTSCRSAAECSISPSRRFRSDLQKRAPQFRGCASSPHITALCNSSDPDQASSLPTGSAQPQCTYSLPKLISRQQTKAKSLSPGQAPVVRLWVPAPRIVEGNKELTNAREVLSKTLQSKM